MQNLQNEILEAVASGEYLNAIAEKLCRRAEELAPEAICTIIGVDSDGVLRPLAGPSLPAYYAEAIDGLGIGPCVGSCGTAAYRREPVEVTDIATDPLWTPYKDVALPLGLAACWSSPIKARDGRVIGTFAFYYRTKRGPSVLERAIVKTCVHLCAIAIEHDEVQSRNHRLAYYDTLTGLPNRAHFNDHLRRRASGRGRPLGLLLIDIDHLKAVNDTLGHAVGDRLIRRVGDAISDGDDGFACRLGGDEFAMLIDDCASAEEMKQRAERLLAMKDQPFQVDGHTIVPRVTIGGAWSAARGVDVDRLCQNADFALYHAKETRRGGYIQFREGLRTAIMRRFQMIEEVSAALVEERVQAYYQPIVSLETGRIFGVEALARMITPAGHVVSAGSFSQALTDPRIASLLTDRMLGQVAADMKAWLDADIAFSHVAINVTTSDFQRGGLDIRIIEAFGAAGVPLDRIVVEVTESVLMGGSDNLVAQTVAKLRAVGVRVALDDFGTGYASLTHLLSVPVDIIKIDKSFVDRLFDNDQGLVIVEALISLARKLEMTVVAEGIETNAQVERLRALGCQLGQGYLFARPCPAETAATLISAFAARRHDIPDEAIAFVA